MMPDDDLLDDDQEGSTADDTGFDTEAGATCPHCGAPVSLTLDPAGGQVQEYVEDCEICCRPWKVQVHYDAHGAADVQLEALE